jgi:hypothetical protein
MWVIASKQKPICNPFIANIINIFTGAVECWNTQHHRQTITPAYLHP